MQNLTYIIGGVVAVLLMGAVVWWLAMRRGKRKAGASTNQLASSLKGERLKSDIILNAIDDGVVLVDNQQVIRLFNPAATNITGWSREEAEGLDWRSVFKFIDEKGEIKNEEAPIEEVFKQGKTIRRNNSHLLTKSSKDLTVAVTVSPLVTESKEISGAVGVFRDISEEKQEEAQRAEFISTASHEMRTPVAAIEGYLSLALNDKVATIDSRAHDYLEKAHSSTQHLGQLFQDLLTSAKAEDGRLTNHPKIVEMGDFLERLTEDLRFTAQKKNLFMEFLIGNNEMIDASTPDKIGGSTKVVRPLYFVQADPDRIREVITNLFDNACKYTDQGKVSLGLTGNGDVVQLYIRDTGAGIPVEDIPHLFQKFYRVDNSATRTIGGTGLGLFISRKIIELYKGRIWVESTVGKGSTFYINLPRIDTARAQAMQAAESTAAAQTVGALSPDNPSVLPLTTIMPTTPDQTTSTTVVS
ncbi:MAG: ATP-binding protein [Candidatus Saccharimonadales bacterium]